jgi:hypothetical protein
MWVPPEQKDPVLLHHPTRKSVGYFGAIRLRDGKLVFQREQGKFNAVTFHAFLKRLRRLSSRSGVNMHRKVYHLCALKSVPPGAFPLT